MHRRYRLKALAQIESTRVVAGTQSKIWLERMSAAADRFELDWAAERAVAAIVEHLETQDA